MFTELYGLTAVQWAALIGCAVLALAVVLALRHAERDPGPDDGVDGPGW